MFAKVTGTAISCSLGRQYKPILSLSFLDIYDVAPLCLNSHLHSYFLLYLLVLSLSFLDIYAVAGTIMFDVVTDTTISCSLGMQYLPVLSLSFLDI